MSIVYLRFAARRLDTRQRSPLLERLVARVARSVRVADWRAEAFRVLAPDTSIMPPIAPTALAAASPNAPSPMGAARGTPPGAWCCIATPVSFSAGMSVVTLPEDGIVELRADEAEVLADDFNRTFVGAGMRLWVNRAATLVCVFDRTLQVDTHDPETMVGHDVFGFQPVGSDAPQLRRLMSEIEMWLFDHALNRARTGAGGRPVTGLWLWGGGAIGAAPAVAAVSTVPALRAVMAVPAAPAAPALPTLPAVQGWTAGHDPFFAAFGGATRFSSDAGSGVVVCIDQPGSTTWADVEQRWLAPAAAAVKAGRIRRLDLSAGGRRFSVGRGPNLLFWRRPRPWWESFDADTDGS